MQFCHFKGFSCSNYKVKAEYSKILDTFNDKSDKFDKAVTNQCIAIMYVKNQQALQA